MSPAFIARALLGVLLSAAAFVAAITTHASPPGVEPVLEAGYWHRPGSADAREFLEHLDARRYAEAFHATGHGFGDHDLARFAHEQRERRARLGAPKCRRPIAQHHEGIASSGLPARIVVRFLTEFEHVTAAEVVNLLHDVDGTYRVDAYLDTPILEVADYVDLPMVERAPDCPPHFVPPAAKDAKHLLTATARAPLRARFAGPPSTAPPTSQDHSRPQPPARYSP